MPITITRILVEGISTGTPNQEVALTVQATGATIGTAMCDGSGAFSAPVQFGLFLQGLAAGQAWAQGVAQPGAQSGGAAGTGGGSGVLTQTQPLAGTAAGTAGVGGTAELPPDLVGTAAGVGGASGTISGSSPLAGTAAGTGGASGTVGTGGGGGLNVSDDFNRANGAAADGTHPWVAPSGRSALTILSNQVTSASGVAAGYWDAAFAANQRAEIAGWAGPANVVVRMQSSAGNTGYRAFWTEVSDGEWTDYYLNLYRGDTSIVSLANPSNSTGTLAIEATGNVIKVYTGAVLQHTYTDAANTYPTGKPGIIIGSPGHVADGFAARDL